MSESTSPVLIRSVSSDGTCRCIFSANRAEICCASVFESGMWHVPVFGREQVEEEAIERTAVDIVTLPLPADVAKVELLEAALRRDVCLDRPRVHGVEPELGKRQREHVVSRLGRMPAVSLVAEHRPERGGLEVPIDVGQAHDPRRRVLIPRRVDPEHMDVPLAHDPERDRRDALDAVTEVKPFVILGLAQPTGDELDPLGGIQWQQFHDGRMPPALSDAWPVPRGVPDGPSPTCRRSDPDPGRPLRLRHACDFETALGTPERASRRGRYLAY